MRGCHPEVAKDLRSAYREILRFAQDDRRYLQMSATVLEVLTNGVIDITMFISLHLDTPASRVHAT